MLQQHRRYPVSTSNYEGSNAGAKNCTKMYSKKNLIGAPTISAFSQPDICFFIHFLLRMPGLRLLFRTGY
jgi:hypothetical protein